MCEERREMTRPQTAQRSIVFGEVRSLSSGAPSAAKWRQLCVILERLWLDEPHHVEAELLPYLAKRLETWPDNMRVMPSSWLGYIEHGDYPPGKLARTLRVKSSWRGKLIGLCRSLDSLELGCLDVSALALNRLELTALRAWCFARTCTLQAAPTQTDRARSMSTLNAALS